MRKAICCGLFFLVSLGVYGMPFAWTEVPGVPEHVVSVHSDHVTGSVFFTVTASGSILRTVDSGDLWIHMPFSSGRQVRGLWMDPSLKHAWFASVQSGNRFELWYSHDNWDSFELRYSSQAEILHISPSRLAPGLVLGTFIEPGDTGTVHLKKSENAGYDWVDIMEHGESGFDPVWHNASVWQAHWGRFVSHDFGDVWSERSNKPVAVCAYDIPPSLMAPTPEGLFRSRDNLSTWWPLLVTTVDFVQLNPRNSRQIVTGRKHPAHSAVLFYSRDSGASFSEWTTGLASGVSDFCIAADWLFLAISDGTLYRYDERQADITGSNRVDGADLIVLATAFGTFAGDPGYCERSDLNNDGVVDGRDLVILSAVFGQRFYYDEDDRHGDFPE